MIPSQEQDQTLAWAGRPVLALLRLAWPIAISMISVSVMTLTDTLFVGWIGAPALAGVGLAGTAAFVSLCFPWGLMGGAKILVSQAVGAGRRSEAPSYLGAAILLAAAIGVLLTLLGVTLAGQLAHFASTPEAGHAAVDYFAIRIWMTPVFLVGVALRETRYGLGDSRSPMVAAVVANVMNVLLDYVLIFPAGLGVQGAALATVISQVAEAAVLVHVQARDGFGLRQATWARVREVWRLGWPSAVQWTLEMGSFSTLAFMISMYDQVQMAAHQIVLQVIHFSFLPAVALSSATSVLCGQAVGAKRQGLVTIVARRSLLIAGSYMGLFSVALALLGRLVVGGFTRDGTVVEAAMALIHIAVLFQVFDAANIVARGALQGTGDVRFPAVVGVALSWLSTPPLMWLLGYRFGMGAAGGWTGLCLEIVVSSLILWWRLERGGWREALQKRSAGPHAAADALIAG